MVSFSCEGCGDILTKKKLDPHRNRCRGATFTCIDCMVHFPGTDYRGHTSCMTEDQKYQGALYKNKKAKTSKNSNDNSKNTNVTFAAPPSKTMAQQAYVEDANGQFADYEYDEGSDDGRSPLDLPEAPTPPPAADGPINVFDFLDPTATPNASTLHLGRNGEGNEETRMVRFDPDAQAYLDASGLAVDEDPDALIQYGTGPIPGAFETPAARGERRKSKDGSHSQKSKDKKRKRLHVDTDQIMNDAPPMLHSGLTGGMNRMMRSQLPPSPDYSGGDGAEPLPGSPLRNSKHSKHATKSKKYDGIGSNLVALMTSGTKSKTKKRKVSSASKKSSRSETRKSSAPKLIEYHRPHTSEGGEEYDEGADGENQMVLFRPRADLLLSYVNKGPESDRGYSMKKALRQFHRERNGSNDFQGKAIEEKELWRSLRMRKNERGEIVLFGL